MSRTIFKHIMFCTDFSENADRAFDVVLHLLQGNPGSSLVLFHIIPQPEAQFWKSYLYEVEDVEDKSGHDIDEKIEQTYIVRLPLKTGYTIVVEAGKVDEKILDYADKNDVDLIVIGRQGRSTSGTFLFGNITEKVARKSRCPVLIVPATFFFSEGEGES
ncbi:MAG: universal stress protein [Spirochaetales bacterium]|nr:universal stress protein [Spirochaetales bacterium]